MDITTSDENGYVVVNKHVVNTQLAITMEDTQEKEAYLFGDNHESTPCFPHFPSYFFHGYTYYYFVSVVTLACLWFVIMIIENAIYRKTTTCHDINVRDNSFTCFNVTKSDFKPIPITCAIGKSPTTEVFCYLFQPNIAAFGIAFSIFKLIIFGVTVYFKIAIKLAESKCAL